MRSAHLALSALVLFACSGEEAGDESEDATFEDVSFFDADDSRAEDARVDTTTSVESGDAIEDSAAEATADDTSDGATTFDARDAASSGDGACHSGGFTGCFEEGRPFESPCPCEAGFLCLAGPCGSSSFAFCAPIPDECDGTPTCECMGCACPDLSGFGGCRGYDGGINCVGPTSRRDAKKDIRYVDDEERDEIAKRAMSMSLASYAYKTDSPDAHRRLGFIIDDQPNPSFAVEDDRTHVDLYGYASVLLATVQAQQKEIAALEKRVEELEKGR